MQARSLCPRDVSNKLVVARLLKRRFQLRGPLLLVLLLVLVLMLVAVLEAAAQRRDVWDFRACAT